MRVQSAPTIRSRRSAMRIETDGGSSCSTRRHRSRVVARRRSAPTARSRALRGDTARRRPRDSAPHCSARQAGASRPAAAGVTDLVSPTVAGRLTRGATRPRRPRHSVDGRRRRARQDVHRMRTPTSLMPDLTAAQPDELRPITFERDYTEMAAGSVLVAFGRHAGAVHRVGRRGRAAVDAGQRQGLGHRRVLDAARLVARAHRARGGEAASRRGAPRRSSG